MFELMQLAIVWVISGVITNLIGPYLRIPGDENYGNKNFSNDEFNQIMIFGLIAFILMLLIGIPRKILFLIKNSGKN